MTSDRPSLWERLRLLRALRLGRELARRAPMLLAEPLEDLLERDLASVQQSLGLPMTA